MDRLFMATDDMLKALEEAVQRRADEMELSKPYYDVDGAAFILEVSKALLYRFLNSPHSGIEPIHFRRDRKSYILADDVRKLYVLLNQPYIKPRDETERPPDLPAIEPAKTRPRIEAIA